MRSAATGLPPPSHGFVRSKNRAITTFDVPGGGTGAGQGTVVNQINAPGAITELYVDANNVYHRYLWNPQSGIERTANVARTWRSRGPRLS